MVDADQVNSAENAAGEMVAPTTTIRFPPNSPIRRGFRWRSLLLGLAILVGFAALRSSANVTLQPTALSDAVTLAVSVLVEVIPFVILGILIAVVIQVWMPRRMMIRVLPKNSFLRRVTLSLMGVFLPVCECGNVPVARSFLIDGLRLSDAVTFLFAAPIVNPITIITTFSAFGWSDVFIGRIIGGFLIANLVGWVFSLLPNDAELLTPAFGAECQIQQRVTGDQKKKFRSQMVRSAEMFRHESSEIFPALVVGATLAGTIQVLVPRDSLLALGSDPLLSVLAFMIFAFVVAICSNVDAFFILAFSSAFMPGAIVAFLVFGAMIDIKMVSLLRSTFATKAIIGFVILIASATLALGMVVNSFGS